MTSRYFVNDRPSPEKPDYFAELLASLERISTFNPPVQTCSTGWTFHGFYAGPTSIAYLFYRLSLLYPDIEFKQQSLLEWAESYLQLSTFLRKSDPDPSHCGIANETLAHIALSSVILNDISLAQALCSYETIINHAQDDGSNEWLYGRAGYLYFLRLCLSHFSKTSASIVRILTKTIEKTTARILAVLLPWKWHGKEYLGAAHGTIGIICQVMLSDPQRVSDPVMTQLLTILLQTQLSKGNFPSSLPAESRDHLVQFCHGGPGFVVSLRSVLRHLQPQQAQSSTAFTLHAAIQTAIEKAQEDIWQRGILRKDPCLCHGIAGNALALDDAKQFNTFLSWMTSKSLEENNWLRRAGHTDDFAGLFVGETGRAWVWAVADKGLEKNCIGFNDI